MQVDLHLFLGPVTSLTVCANKIVAGCGNGISIFSLANSTLQSKHSIFTGAALHGLIKGPCDGQKQLLCVFGEKKVCVVALTHYTSECEHSEVTFLSRCIELKDWIWDAKWLQSEDQRSSSIALALAHNCVVQWDWQRGCVMNESSNTEKCILYSAHLIHDTWDSLVLAAGTVFNKVVIWPVSGPGPERNTVHVGHTLSGHKGVIFSICYRDDLQKIASASDDRSIRIWSLNLPSSSSKSDWDSMESELLICVYGHSARVWKVLLLGESFASVGEDATALVWDYKGNVLQKFKGHKGRSVWSMTCTEDEKHLITGGGDASIRQWEIQETSDQKTSQKSLNIPPSLCQGSEDFPRSVCLLNFNSVMVMMNSGTLIQYQSQADRYTEVFIDPLFYSYSVMSPSTDNTALAVGSMEGQIKLVIFNGYHVSTIMSKHLFSGKVLSLCWLNNQNLLASGPVGQILLLSISPGEPTTSIDPAIDVHYELNLPDSKHRWVSAGCLLPPESRPGSTSSDCKLIVCGDKDGSVHCYKVSQSLNVQEEQYPSQNEANILPHQSFCRVHGKTGVTSVCYRDGFLYTTGRDGCYRQWRVADDCLELLHSHKVLKGFDWLDRLEWHDGDLLLVGFFSSEFVVWSLTYNQQLLSVSCGGGHRSWGWACQGLTNLRFVYLKAGTVHFVDTESEAKQTILQAPVHGRELCDVKIIGSVSKDQDSPSLMVCTASEDTTINIGLLHWKSGLCTLDHLACLKGHLSSVRTLATVPSSAGDSQRNCQRSNLIFTAGGRAELRVWRVNIHKASSLTHLSQTEVSGHPPTVGKSGTPDYPPSMQASHENRKEELNSSGTKCQPSNIRHENISEDDDQVSVNGGHGRIDSAPNVQCTMEQLCVHFLGESRHKRSHSSWKSHKLCLDPETRIMKLAVTTLRELAECVHMKDHLTGGLDRGDHTAHSLRSVYLVTTAGSDGIIRIFSFDEATGKFSLQAQSDYHKGCILQVHHHICQREKKTIPLLFSASTNGQILVWNLSYVVEKMFKDYAKILGRLGKEGDCDVSEDETDEKDDDLTFSTDDVSHDADWLPVCSVSAHQSGVNSLHTLHISDSQVLTATGGDDNAVTVSLLDVTETAVTVRCQGARSDAHSAQVTGIWLLDSSTLVSASIDQRMCVWNFDLSLGQGFQLKMLTCKYINVADVSSMDVCLIRNSVFVLIGGEGLCLYSFPRPELVQNKELNPS